MFRKAQESDLLRIAEIHVAAWHYAYQAIIDEAIFQQVTVASRHAIWKKWFRAGKHDTHLMIVDSQIVGFCCTCAARALHKPPKNYGELTHLYIEPSMVSTGLGFRLFEFSKQRLQSKSYRGMLLWTLEDNARARRFYEMQGMQADGARHCEPEWQGEGVFEVRYTLPF